MTSFHIDLSSTLLSRSNYAGAEAVAEHLYLLYLLTRARYSCLLTSKSVICFFALYLVESLPIW